MCCLRKVGPLRCDLSHLGPNRPLGYLDLVDAMRVKLMRWIRAAERAGPACARQQSSAPFLKRCQSLQVAFVNALKQSKALQRERYLGPTLLGVSERFHFRPA